MFALIDCNNFFVSCERVFRPDLERRPVVVLSSNDGCVIARSNEAKLLGIPMSAPLFEIRHLVKAYDVETLSCNFELYGDMSHRVMNMLQQQFKNVEIYSIDEAFLTLDNAVDWSVEGENLQKYILQCTGIPTSIGFGPTKTLAKLANIQAKSLGAPCYINNTAEHHANLKTIPISQIWGIGTRLSKNLKQQGIYSVYDLMTTEPGWIRRNYSIVVERIVNELNGVSCLPLTLVQEPKKSIQITRSFSKPIKDKEILMQAAARYGFRLSTKLRELSQKSMTLFVYAQNSPFGSEACVLQQRTITLPEPTNSTSVIIGHAQDVIEQLFDSTIAYHKIGIMAVDLRDAKLPNARALFNEKKSSARPEIDKVMDSLNKRFGLGTIRPLSCGESVEWMNKRDNKTPAYTTNWKNLVQVKAN